MNKEQLLGLVRHTLTFVGGLLIMKGWLDDILMQELIGAAATLVGGIWSVITKSKTTP